MIRNRTRRGLALAVTLLVLIIIVTLGFGLSIVGINHVNIAEMDLKSKQTEYVAEAGAVNAIEQITASSSFSNTQGYAVTVGGQTANVFVFQNTGSGNQTCLKDGKQIPGGMDYVFSTSTSPDGRVTRKTAVLVSIAQTSVFKYAEFANVNMTLSGGSSVDSYDSSAGAYGGANKGSQGDIGINGVASDAVDLSGGTTVHGSASLGPGAVQATTLNTHGSTTDITGTVSDLTVPQPLPTPSAPSGLVTDGSISGTVHTVTGTPGHAYGDVHVSSGSITLPPGNYEFNSLTLSGGSQIILPGPGSVNITIVSSLDISGGSAADGPVHRTDGTVGKPSQLEIQALPGAGTLKVSGGSDAAYAVYAPTAEIDVTGGSDIFGALVANNLKNTGGTSVHYDTQLGKGAGTPTVVPMGWQRT